MADPTARLKLIFGETFEMVGLLGGAGDQILEAAFTDDVEFEFVGPRENDNPVTDLQGASTGRAALMSAWREWLEAYSSYVITLERVHPLGETSALAEVESVARTRTGDVEVRQRQAGLFEFRDGRISRWQAWLHADDAKAAFGL